MAQTKQDRIDAAPYPAGGPGRQLKAEDEYGFIRAGAAQLVDAYRRFSNEGL